MHSLKKYIFFLLLAAGLTACKKWDDHVAVTNQDLQQSLWQTISSNANLSTFSGYVKEVGLDTLLQSSRNFTVWAPTNDALRTLDAATVNDPAKLKSFVQNHISVQSYFKRDAQSPVRVAMLNGKYNTFTGARLGDATIGTADKFVSNGVLHTLDKFIPVLPSLWDFVTTTGTQFRQNAFITGLGFTDFDPSLAVVDSISATTGKPVYRPGTGMVARNRFNSRVHDLQDETKQYTYFVVQDAAFATETDNLKKYYATTDAAATDSLARWHTVKELVVEGVYPTTALAGLQSKFGVQLPIDASQVVETRTFSNGIVHVLRSLSIPAANRYKEILIQGENPSGFVVDRRGNTNYREKLNPVTNEKFKDILVSGHGYSAYYAFYRLADLPTIKYKVYGLAVNDFQTGAVTQNILIRSFMPPATYSTLATLPFAVPLNTAAGAYDEKYLGEVTITASGLVEVQLTASGTNPIVLDYLRLVPQL